MGKLTKELAEAMQGVDHVRAERTHEREVAKLKADLAKSEQKRKHAEQELAEHEAIAEFRDGIKGDGGKSHRAYKYRKPSGSATAVVCLNDIHGEETVDPATINGLNEYNLEIAERRLDVVANSVLLLLDAERRKSHIRDLVVWLGGDIITGNIHEELAEENALSPIEACRWAKWHLIGLLDHWLEHADVDSVSVVTSKGNHGRTTAKPRIATSAKHSYEWGMYEDMADIYAARGDKRIQFKNDRGYFNWLDIQDKRVRFHHGDWIKYNGGVGGITIPVNKAINEWNKSERADYDVFGHWHQHKKGHLWASCNCLIGYNAYAQSIKAEFSVPTQTMFVFDAKRHAPVSVLEVFCD